MNLEKLTSTYPYPWALATVKGAEVNPMLVYIHSTMVARGAYDFKLEHRYQVTPIVDGKPTMACALVSGDIMFAFVRQGATMPTPEEIEQAMAFLRGDK